MPGKSTISREAALTLLLHAAKFPAAAVNGLLLGNHADLQEGGSVSITSAVPLLHTFLTLAPSLETALFLVRPLLSSVAQLCPCCTPFSPWHPPWRRLSSW